MTSEQYVPGLTLERRRLPVGPKLSDGGQGRVYLLDDSPVHVYKEYTLPDINGAALDRLIAFRLGLSPEARAAVDDASAWPLVDVTDSGRTVGFVMRRAPVAFEGVFKARRKLLELQYLLYPPKPAWASLPQPDIEQRVELARKYAQIFHFLHERSIVVGDVSFGNLLWSVAGDEPRVFLLDCDGCRHVGRHPVTPQAETKDWHDPLTSCSSATLDSDRFKLALVIGRLLSQQPYATPASDLALLPGVPRRIEKGVRRAFARAAGARGSRPAARDWLSALAQGPEFSGLPDPALAPSVVEPALEPPPPLTGARPVIQLRPREPAS
jgi:DNA-binding helix-hairpin-helix protein with protein kinase domain